MGVDNFAFGIANVRWELAELYTGTDAPELDRDLNGPVEAAERFAKRYRGKVNDLDAAGLARACREQEALLTPLYRALAYAELRLAQRADDAEAQVLLGRCQQRLTAAASRMAFFEVEWNAVDDSRATALLEDDAVGAYRHSLEGLRRYRPHRLGEGEERILAELAQSGVMAWERLFDHLVSEISVEFEGGASGLGGVLPVLYDADRDRRRDMHGAVSRALEEGVETRAMVLNAIVGDAAIRDRLRRHGHWLQAHNLENEVSDLQVRMMLEAVGERYEIVSRYYGLKARLLGLDELLDYDRYAALPDPARRPVGWEEAVETVLEAYRSFSPYFGRVAAEFFERGWVDAPPRPGKQRGAFARATTPDHHPYVLLNFTGRTRDVLTLAHELGHGVHMRLAQRQTLANMDAPPILAETGSLFCEALTVGRLLEDAREPGTRLALLARYVEDLFVTVFRHAAMHEFEDAIHTAVRVQGELGAEEIGQEWLRTQERMFGGSVMLTDAYGAWWSYVPHFFLAPGSSYAYVFGNLVALALYRRYQEIGRKFVAPYLEMLAAGGSRRPNDILSTLGVHPEDPAFWHDGLDILEGYVREAERLAG